LRMGFWTAAAMAANQCRRWLRRYLVSSDNRLSQSLMYSCQKSNLWNARGTLGSCCLLNDIRPRFVSFFMRRGGEGRRAARSQPRVPSGHGRASGGSPAGRTTAGDVARWVSRGLSWSANLRCQHYCCFILSSCDSVCMMPTVLSCGRWQPLGACCFTAPKMH